MSFSGMSKLLPPGYKWAKVEITERIWDGPDCYPWREVRAWMPVKTISGRHVWLKKIYKRRFWAVWGLGFHMEPMVEYATLLEIVANTDK